MIIKGLSAKNNAKSKIDLGLEFGNYFYKKFARVGLLLEYPYVFPGFLGSMLAYMDMDLIYETRDNLFSIRKPNESVRRLRHLWSKKLAPSVADEDPAVLAILIALGQRIHRPQSRDVLTQDSLCKVITVSGRKQMVSIYTASVSPTFLERFRRPERSP